MTYDVNNQCNGKGTVSLSMEQIHETHTICAMEEELSLFMEQNRANTLSSANEHYFLMCVLCGHHEGRGGAVCKLKDEEATVGVPQAPSQPYAFPDTFFSILVSRRTPHRKQVLLSEVLHLRTRPPRLRHLQLHVSVWGGVDSAPDFMNPAVVVGDDNEERHS